MEHSGPTATPHRRARVIIDAETNLRARRRAGAEQLDLAHAWALEAHLETLHGDADGRPLHPRDVRRIGASRYPVHVDACAELAVAWEIHPLAAQRLMADAVDLHTRLPLTWAAVQELRLEAWVARKIAALTAHLDRDAAGTVDVALAGVVGSLPVGRLLSLAEGRTVEADPDAWEARVAARRRLGVFLGRENRDGIRTLLLRLRSVDAMRLYALIVTLARLITATGDLATPAAAPGFRDGRCATSSTTGDEHATSSTTGDDVSAGSTTEEPLDAEAEEAAPPDPEPSPDRPDTVSDVPAEPEPADADACRARAAGLLADPHAALDVLAGRDPRAGKAVVYVHTSVEALRGHGISRVEELGPHTQAMLADLLGHDHITLKPVIDLNQGAAADCYEVPASIAERQHLAMPADVFPWAESLSRYLDLDHTIPYDDTGPPGQTRIGNLGKMVRRHHHTKTHASGWRLEQLPGFRYRWTTPTGRQVIVDPNGTHPVSTSPTTRRASSKLKIDWVWAA